MVFRASFLTVLLILAYIICSFWKLHHTYGVLLKKKKKHFSGHSIIFVLRKELLIVLLDKNRVLSCGRIINFPCPWNPSVVTEPCIPLLKGIKASFISWLCAVGPASILFPCLGQPCMGQGRTCCPHTVPERKTQRGPCPLLAHVRIRKVFEDRSAHLGGQLLPVFLPSPRAEDNKSEIVWICRRVLLDLHHV